MHQPGATIAFRQLASPKLSSRNSNTIHPNFLKLPDRIYGRSGKGWRRIQREIFFVYTQPGRATTASRIFTHSGAVRVRSKRYKMVRNRSRLIRFCLLGPGGSGQHMGCGQVEHGDQVRPRWAVAMTMSRKPSRLPMPAAAVPPDGRGSAGRLGRRRRRYGYSGRQLQPADRCGLDRQGIFSSPTATAMREL